jgi:peroxin-7
VEFSPFEERKLACATAQHFGIIGNGKQYIFDVHDREIAPFRSFDSREGLYLNLFWF